MTKKPLPADKPIEEFFDLLIAQAGLPRIDQNGRQIAYDIIHPTTNQPLDLTKSFVEQGIAGLDKIKFRRTGVR